MSLYSIADHAKEQTMTSLLSAWTRRIHRPNIDQSRIRRGQRKVAQRASKPRLEILEERYLLSYSMIDLGTLGGAGSYPAAINNSGQVVGTSETASGATHAFVWDSSQGMQDLGTFGGPNSFAVAINDSGQVAGYADTSTGGHAFEWDSSHGMQDLGTLGGSSSQAFAMNDAGQVAGVAQTASGADHAFAWDSSHGMQDLGTLASSAMAAYGDSIVVTGINNSGQVVGDSETASGAYHAFEWDSSHGMQDLGTLGGTAVNGIASQATAINDSGQVVGNSYTASGAPTSSSGTAATECKTSGYREEAPRSSTTPER
jgi:probable HAF family extracellular repeat protein